MIGLALMVLNVPIPDVVSETSATLKSAFVALGMMIIGLTLSSFDKIKFDFKFITMAMFIRFCVWPALVFGVVALDSFAFGGVFKDIYPIIILFGFLPIGADFAIYAANLNMYPQRAATVVLFSTLLAAFIIPLVYSLLQG